MRTLQILLIIQQSRRLWEPNNSPANTGKFLLGLVLDERSPQKKFGRKHFGPLWLEPWTHQKPYILNKDASRTCWPWLDNMIKYKNSHSHSRFTRDSWKLKWILVIILYPKNFIDIDQIFQKMSPFIFLEKNEEKTTRPLDVRERKKENSKLSLKKKFWNSKKKMIDL